MKLSKPYRYRQAQVDSAAKRGMLATPNKKFLVNMTSFSQYKEINRLFVLCRLDSFSTQTHSSCEGQKASFLSKMPCNSVLISRDVIYRSLCITRADWPSVRRQSDRWRSLFRSNSLYNEVCGWDIRHKVIISGVDECICCLGHICELCEFKWEAAYLDHGIRELITK